MSGKYDEHAVNVLKAVHADTVVVIVMGGDLGAGFSVASREPSHVFALPGVLMHMAHQIEGEVKGVLNERGH